LESPRLRASLGESVLFLHATFARDVRETLERLVDDSEQAAALAAGLVSLLDGNLVLSLFESQGASAELRRAGLRTLAQLAFGDASEPPRVPQKANGSSACVE
jgi:hypothetical protein